MLDHHFCVAPMLDWTDRHERYFLRLISRHSLLYTEMVTTQAILCGDRDYHLGFHASEHPLSLQLGGSEPTELAECCRIAHDYGYDEINLNIGCPSDRVQSGRFGACLMAEPHLVAECVAAMGQASSTPISVKSRIGIDDQDDYEDLYRFIDFVSQAGCDTFIIHARKAWLQGLSPKENREIPPLRYELVQQIKRDFPHLRIIINGGIKSLDQAETLLCAPSSLDGVMLGREIYHNPYLLAEVDKRFYGDDHPIPSRHEIVEALLPYIATHLQQGGRLQQITRHITGLFHGIPGARRWRQILSEQAHLPGADGDTLNKALGALSKY